MHSTAEDRTALQRTGVTVDEAHGHGVVISGRADQVRKLRRLGYDVTTTDVECCGMAGSFGYKSEYYEVSMDVGEQLRQQLDEPGNAERVPVASGTSCLEQIDALLAREPTHPIELLDPDRDRVAGGAGSASGR
jgi:hypothetical protein